MHSLNDEHRLYSDPSPQAPIQLSIIDLVLAATEASEDEFEVNDGIAGLIQSGAVKILPRKDDPMLTRADPPEPETRVSPLLPTLYPAPR